ncbi:LAMP family protein lmp-1 [Lingula anatina]|uniref:Lysosome-associated membrane glycoprotein 5 n=1 Tax=Lingula anatina TaxID=7574 RepID=A0A1S3IH56_LINAN|nr:LAMP family protein lmp-1 [Lingula anatina]|eukprot:XP_013396819.1 LAMP family protein lmp-1 [Lingula anatina]
MESKMTKYLLIGSLCVAFVAAQNNTTIAATTTVTTPTTTVKTTIVTTSTTSSGTTATQAPTTSNSTNSSTTQSSTTQPSTTQPSTTTSPITTSAKPEWKTFVVSNGSVDCIILQMNAQFTIKYMDVENKTKDAKFILPHNSSAAVEGNCLNALETITINMYDNAVSMTMRFTNDGNNVALANATVEYNTKDSTVFPNATDVKNSSNGHFDNVQAPVNSYYRCNSAINPTFDDKVSVTITNLKVTAFNQNNKTDDFGGGKETVCLADTQTDNIVPIAVGAALAGLVVIVLIAYLIGRRTNRQGYQSV